MASNKQKKIDGKRFLVTINVLGSAGPLRFVVDEEENVGDVIGLALKSYARERRLPVLGTDARDFHLYCPLSRSDALNPWGMIGAHGARTFVLCKKPDAQKAKEVGSRSAGFTRKGSGSWKTWINKTLNSNTSH